MTSLRQTLSERAVIGTFVKVPRPEIVDLMALAGFDFVVCDFEHGQMDERDVLETVRASQGAGLPIVIRVPDMDRGFINRALEAGAAGIKLASTVGAAAPALADAMRYPPLGSRSLSTIQPSASYGHVPLVEYVERSNAEVLVVGQFETANYAEALDEAVAALDVAFIGPVDLSLDLGTPGDLESTVVKEAIAEVERAAEKAGTPMGIYAGNAAAARAALDRGYRYVVVSSDLGVLAAGADQLVAEIRATS